MCGNCVFYWLELIDFDKAATVNLWVENVSDLKAPKYMLNKPL